MKGLEVGDEAYSYGYPLAFKAFEASSGKAIS